MIDDVGARAILKLVAGRTLTEIDAVELALFVHMTKQRGLLGRGWLRGLDTAMARLMVELDDDRSSSRRCRAVRSSSSRPTTGRS